MKNNGTLFYWHLELLHHTLLHTYQEMMKGKVEQPGFSGLTIFYYISKLLNMEIWKLWNMLKLF